MTDTRRDLPVPDEALIAHDFHYDASSLAASEDSVRRIAGPVVAAELRAMADLLDEQAGRPTAQPVDLLRALFHLNDRAGEIERQGRRE